MICTRLILMRFFSLILPPHGFQENSSRKCSGNVDLFVRGTGGGSIQLKQEARRKAKTSTTSGQRATTRGWCPLASAVVGDGEGRRRWKRRRRRREAETTTQPVCPPRARWRSQGSSRAPRTKRPFGWSLRLIALSSTLSYLRRMSCHLGFRGHPLLVWRVGISRGGLSL